MKNFKEFLAESTEPRQKSMVVAARKVIGVKGKSQHNGRGGVEMFHNKDQKWHWPTVKANLHKFADDLKSKGHLESHTIEHDPQVGEIHHIVGSHKHYDEHYRHLVVNEKPRKWGNGASQVGGVYFTLSHLNDDMTRKD